MGKLNEKDKVAFVKILRDLHEISEDILDVIEITEDLSLLEELIACLKDFANKQKAKRKL